MSSFIDSCMLPRTSWSHFDQNNATGHTRSLISATKSSKKWEFETFDCIRIIPLPAKFCNKSQYTRAKLKNCSSGTHYITPDVNWLQLTPWGWQSFFWQNLPTSEWTKWHAIAINTWGNDRIVQMKNKSSFCDCEILRLQKQCCETWLYLSWN